MAGTSRMRVFIIIFAAGSREGRICLVANMIISNSTKHTTSDNAPTKPQKRKKTRAETAKQKNMINHTRRKFTAKITAFLKER